MKLSLYSSGELKRYNKSKTNNKQANTSTKPSGVDSAGNITKSPLDWMLMMPPWPQALVFLVGYAVGWPALVFLSIWHTAFGDEARGWASCFFVKVARTQTAVQHGVANAAGGDFQVPKKVHVRRTGSHWTYGAELHRASRRRAKPGRWEQSHRRMRGPERRGVSKVAFKYVLFLIVFYFPLPNSQAQAKELPAITLYLTLR